ncbi:RagB/SusD family nutrient uptake outer membrane protein [Pedobacter sp. HMF7647]|uniref:RagB/SusD family nutrient uptake outer membrane protein n=1 Tax=Hufsiella arboris TaxID=2695275 RepID=A0A7K1YB45_9SPHI|nr:RagB/SusD family nutrient uptake outer membrane protein [Hufsiella arboris]MXV51650.1 RagB/SusD family nutrient uptake outer membrane protein [Hufsiella arboris]
MRINIKHILLAGLVAVSATSCDKDLDILPEQYLDESQALASDANVKKVLHGAYNALSSSYLLGGDAQLYSELLAADGEIRWVGTFSQPREIYGKNILTTNSYVRDTWLNAYNTINICNNVLGAIDKVATADQNRVKGEASFIRGLVYFELVEYFAKPYSAGGAGTDLGVPILLTGTTEISEESKVKRNTIEETYNQAISDLTAAESLLPVTNDVYATKTACAAILSRVYLQIGKYNEALQASNRAIGYNSKIVLTDTYEEAFNNSENSSEDIFAIQVNEQDGANDMQLFFSIPDYGGRDGDVEVTDKHLALYEDDDARLALFYEGSGAIRSGKWKLQYKNLPIIRLAEMYLTRAECNARLTSSIGDTPQNDLDKIRDRVGLTSIPATLDNIVKERKLELALEGQTIHDAKRMKKSVDGLPYDSNKLVFPIPQREMDANSNLIQNPGYGG